jgi:hypothetical protein
MKYKKKPVVIEAFKWTGGPEQTEDPEWIVDAIRNGAVVIPEGLLIMEINTLEGVMIAREGDYIIKGIQGELYPCKPDVFFKSYEAIENDEDMS